MTIPRYGSAQSESDGGEKNRVNRADNIVDSHDASSHDRHLGRDSAVAGGVGAAGLGAYEASKKHDTKSSGFGTQRVTDQRNPISSPNPTSASYGTTNGPSSTTAAPSTGLAATESKLRDQEDGRHFIPGAGNSISSSNPIFASQPTPAGISSTTAAPSTGLAATDAKLREQKDSRHFVPGAAAEDTKDRGLGTQDIGIKTLAGTGAAATGLGAYEAHKYHDEKKNVAGQQSTLSHNQKDNRHVVPGAATENTRDQRMGIHGDAKKTLAGTGAAATGLGAYEAHQHHDKKENVLDQQPNLSHKQKEGILASTSNNTDEKRHEDRDVAAVGAAGAAGAGAHHEYSKHEAEKLAKEQQKQEEKLAKEREREAVKHHKEHERDVKHHEKDAKHHEKAAAKHEKEEEHENKKGHERKPSLIHRILHRHKDKHENEEAEAAAEDSKHGHHVVTQEHNGHNKLHKDPPAGYIEQQQAHDRRSLEKRARAGSSAGRTGTGGVSQGEGILMDPHTGLPMNVGKYGDGHGGTDANPAIQGARSGTAGTTATDWEAIRKADTPY
jgi:hypothetical protein